MINRIIYFVYEYSNFVSVAASTQDMFPGLFQRTDLDRFFDLRVSHLNIFVKINLKVVN